MKQVCLVLVLLLILPVTLADSGPKPQMTVKVLYDGTPVQDAYAEFLDCYTQEHLDSYQEHIAQYQESTGVNRINPSLNFVTEDQNCLWYPSNVVRNMGCDLHVCQFSYFMPDQFRLSFYLPSQDRVWVSDVIERDHFISEYNMNLRSDGIVDVTNVSRFMQSNSWRDFMSLVKMFLLFGIIKVAISTVVLSLFKNKRRYAFWTLPSTLLLILFLIIMTNKGGSPLLLVPVVLLMILIDALILHKGSSIRWRNSLITSIGANLAGLILGFMAYMLLNIFFY